MESKHRFPHRRSDRSRFVSVLLNVLVWSAVSVLLAGPQAYALGRAAAEAERTPTVSTPAVVLRAASGATIPFWTQNSDTVEGIPAEAFDLPHLVLYRNGALTPADERTLILEVSGIAVPASGVTVTIELETQHGAPNSSGEAGQRISAWRESRWMARPLNAPGTGVTALFSHTFGATVVSGSENIATPTDYFRYEVAVTDANHPPTDPVHAFSGDYAFLMESQWVARLPAVREESPGAAPDELVVYYADMFPFRKDVADPSTWLPREDVPDYVGSELLPQMVEAFRIQTDEWGYPWTLAWTSYRPEDPERLSVALSDGRTWFHGGAPTGGHSGISINVSRGIDSAAYDTLTDGLLSRFHHELFHNLQRNLNLSLGGDGRVDGAENAWQFFTEGTAVLASSVGQPGVEFAPSVPRRAYMRHVNASTLWDVGRFQDLIASDQESDPYSAAIYWRFLYEQCGGMQDGIEDPFAGMQIVRRALTVLYRGEVIDIASSTDRIGAAPKVLDRALAGSSCPFQTYRESLTAFARALYALRLDGGRCIKPGLPAGCGLYDPHHLYREPNLKTIPFVGTVREVRRDLPSSFGLAFVDVALDPAANGQALVLEFYVSPALDAEFHVQVLQLVDSGAGSISQRAPVRSIATELSAEEGPGGQLFYVIPGIHTAAYNRLGLIVARLDAQGASDPVGEYRITLHPGAGSTP